MRPEARDIAYIRDMLESAERVIAYASGRSEEALRKDFQFSDAVYHRIQIIGEIARKLTPTFVAAHPEIPWRKIIVTRHILVHDYDEVDDEIVWRIVQEHLPTLTKQLQAVLKDAPPLATD